MNKLYLMRHANAPFGNSNRDFERSLDDRGRRQAISVSEHINRAELKFDKVMHSTAPRVLETLSILQDLCKDEFSAEPNPDIYNSDLNHFTNLVRNINPQYKNVLIIGHNPTIYQFILYFATNYKETILPEIGMPGANFVEMFFDEEWANITPNKYKIGEIFTPMD